MSGGGLRCGLRWSAVFRPTAQHLATDVTKYNIDVAVITETHFKSRSKYSDSIVSVDGHTVYRSDRVFRRGI